MFEFSQTPNAGIFFFLVTPFLDPYSMFPPILKS